MTISGCWCLRSNFTPDDLNCSDPFDCIEDGRGSPRAFEGNFVGDSLPCVLLLVQLLLLLNFLAGFRGRVALRVEVGECMGGNSDTLRCPSLDGLGIPCFVNDVVLVLPTALWVLGSTRSILFTAVITHTWSRTCSKDGRSDGFLASIHLVRWITATDRDNTIKLNIYQDHTR